MKTSENSEQVVLLDDGGTPIGVADKATVHHEDTPLHLAFSCHVFSPDGRVLVTRRALGKKTWPGVWTNAVCGHPGPGEDMAAAISRRVLHEVGLDITDVRPVLPNFRYRAVDASGVVENEICPVFTALSTGTPHPRDDEISQWEWVDPHQLRTSVQATPFAFSPWLVMQLDQWPERYSAG